MASAQSAAFRSPAGFAQRPSFTPTFPAYPAMPTMPAVPQIDEARAPNAVGRQILSGQLTDLGNQQNAAFTGIRAGAKQALAGYGGWQFSEDDPNTPQREDLLLGFDSKAGMGEREKGAYRGQRDQANAAGMLESSFANQNIASAIQRVSLEAQAIANQYATSINATASNFSREAANVVSRWADLYGADSTWLAQNPPPTPPQQFHPADPEGWTPAQRAAAPPEQHMTYADFLRGRKSTAKLARQWDVRWNRSRRFG